MTVDAAFAASRYLPLFTNVSRWVLRARGNVDFETLNMCLQIVFCFSVQDDDALIEVFRHFEGHHVEG